MKKFFILFLLFFGNALAMDDSIRKSRLENYSTPFPFSKSWGDILFYEKDQPYYEFTNFYESSIEIDGETWPTTEHYFQAQKFPDNPGIREYIRTRCRGARDAFNAGSSDRNKHAAMNWRDWNKIKWDVMYRAVKSKFTQHEDLKNLLIETGDRVLVEDSHLDTYWGIGLNEQTGKNGYNNLGIILMKVRDELSEE